MKQITTDDLYTIFNKLQHDKKIKEMNVVAFHSKTVNGADLEYYYAYTDKAGIKSMQKLADIINEFFYKQNGQQN